MRPRGIEPLSLPWQGSIIASIRWPLFERVSLFDDIGAGRSYSIVDELNVLVDPGGGPDGPFT